MRLHVYVSKYDSDAFDRHVHAPVDRHIPSEQ